MADETYRADRLSHPPPLDPPASWNELHSGSGVPPDTLGINGDVYIDLDSGDIYRKYGDTWTLFAGGAGATEVTKGVVDPEGAVTKTAPHIYVNTANQTFWVKESGSGNTGWRQYI